MKRIKIIICLFLTIVLLVGCSTTTKTDKKKETKKLTIDEKVKNKMSKMTLEQKIAQMLILYSSSDTVDGDFKNILKTYNPGGFILMQDNITTFDKTKKFVDDMQENSDIPMIISIDEEGGNVQRLLQLKDVNPTNIPYMYYLGQTNDTSLAYQVGKLTAEELRTIGVNVDYAPVLDIYSNENNKVFR